MNKAKVQSVFGDMTALSLLVTLICSSTQHGSGLFIR